MIESRKDEYAWVIDYLPHGKADAPPHKRRPIAQAVGEVCFSLLELIPKKGVMLSVGERVYIGEGERDRVERVERRIRYDWLTPTAKSELKEVLEKIVRAQEKRFVEFFNTAGIITTRLHKLEVLPRIGKKCRDEILEQRGRKSFESFEDMSSRVKVIPNPVEVLVEEIIRELRGETKYRFFVIAPEPKFRRRGRFLRGEFSV